MPQEAPLPPRRYLSREEAATWLGVSVDTFMKFEIPFIDLGPRCKRWDIVDIVRHADDNKSRDSARTSETQRRRPICDFTSAKARRNGGSIGETRTESDIAEVLELTIES